jgi:hypothetical protein
LPFLPGFSEKGIINLGGGPIENVDGRILCRNILTGGVLDPSIVLEEAAVTELAHLQKNIATESWSNNSHTYLMTFAGTKINHTLNSTIETLIKNIDIEESFYQLKLHKKGTSGNELLKQVHNSLAKIAQLGRLIRLTATG